MKKKTIIRLAIILGIALLIFLLIAKKNGWIGKSNMRLVSVERVTKRNITEVVPANGKIQPEKEVKITPYISGEVIEIYVKEGQEVKEGDLLAKIDPEIYKSNYERMLASLNSQIANEANMNSLQKQAEAQMIKAETDFNRAKKLYENEVISSAEYENAKSAYDIANAQLDGAKENVKSAQYMVSSARASLSEAKESLTKTTVFSPMNGTVSKLSVEKGERVAGASQFSSGTELMRVANLENMEVNVEVSESDIVRVNVGDTVSIEVDAYFEKNFQGIVTEMATSASTTGLSSDQATNFYVKIKILPDSYDYLLKSQKKNSSPFRPGMSASVEIQTKKAEMALSVPIQSVTTREDSTRQSKSETSRIQENKKMQSYVFLVENGKVQKQKVESGIQDNMYIQILSGLQENQEVVSAPYSAINEKLEDGDEVKAVDNEKLFDTKKK